MSSRTKRASIEISSSDLEINGKASLHFAADCKPVTRATALRRWFVTLSRVKRFLPYIFPYTVWAITESRPRSCASIYRDAEEIPLCKIGIPEEIRISELPAAAHDRVEARHVRYRYREISGRLFVLLFGKRGAVDRGARPPWQSRSMRSESSSLQGPRTVRREHLSPSMGTPRCLATSVLSTQIDERSSQFALRSSCFRRRWTHPCNRPNCRHPRRDNARDSSHPALPR